jgi:hypothetical protein
LDCDFALVGFSALPALTLAPAACVSTGAALTGAGFAVALATDGAAFLLGLGFLTALFLLFPRCGICILSGW